MFIKDIVGKDEEETTLPKTVPQFIKLLNSLFPEQSPDISDEMKDIYFKAGQRDVVRFINQLKERDK
jgi:hypothetical protein